MVARKVNKQHRELINNAKGINLKHYNWTTQQKEPNNNKRNQTIVRGIEQG